MATGAFNLVTSSIDYGGGRGALVVNSTINWATDANGVISFAVAAHSGSTGWYVWNSATRLYLYLNGAQVLGTVVSPVGSYPGGPVGPPGDPYVTTLLNQLVGQLGTYAMPQGGTIHLAYGADSANPTAAFPNAFPTWAVSSADQAGSVIPPADFRPGERLEAGAWQSHNRPIGGVCERLAGSWVEMKTKVGNGDPPERLISGTWTNQAKLGANAG